eukprot:scaffold88048_cov69-Phaeocystis_antarctica.AAC.12
MNSGSSGDVAASRKATSNGVTSAVKMRAMPFGGVGDLRRHGRGLWRGYALWRRSCCTTWLFSNGAKPQILKTLPKFVVSLQASTRRSVVDEGVASFATSEISHPFRGRSMTLSRLTESWHARTALHTSRGCAEPRHDGKTRPARPRSRNTRCH